MKNLLLSLGLLALSSAVFGCRSGQEAVHPRGNPLSNEELEVLSSYYQTPAKVRQAAEICLQHRLTKGQVLDRMSDVMRIEMGRGKIAFYYAPSQIMRMHYDTNGVIIRVDDAAFDITRDDIGEHFANKAPEDTARKLADPQH